MQPAAPAGPVQWCVEGGSHPLHPGDQTLWKQLGKVISELLEMCVYLQPFPHSHVLLIWAFSLFSLIRLDRDLSAKMR